MNKLFFVLTSQSFGKILIFSLLLTGFYWYAAYDNGDELQNQLGTVIQQVEDQQRKKKDTDSTLKQELEMKEKVGAVSQKFQEISKKLPSTLFSNDINRTIDEAASLAKVSVKFKRPLEVIKHPIVDEVPVEVKIEGTYSEISQFCSIIASTERLSRVKNVSISDYSLDTKKIKFEAVVVGYKLASDEKKESAVKEKTP